MECVHVPCTCRGSRVSGAKAISARGTKTHPQMTPFPPLLEWFDWRARSGSGFSSDLGLIVGPSCCRVVFFTRPCLASRACSSFCCRVEVVVAAAVALAMVHERWTVHKTWGFLCATFGMQGMLQCSTGMSLSVWKPVEDDRSEVMVLSPVSMIIREDMRRALCFPSAAAASSSPSHRFCFSFLRRFASVKRIGLLRSCFCTIFLVLEACATQRANMKGRSEDFSSSHGRICRRLFFRDTVYTDRRLVLRGLVRYQGKKAAVLCREGCARGIGGLRRADSVSRCCTRLPAQAEHKQFV